MKRCTADDIVYGEIEAVGPVTFGELVDEVLDQVVSVNDLHMATYSTVDAINRLMREGRIKLYDTGTAWVVNDA